MNEGRLFIVLSQARFGSTLLVHLINQLKQAHCYGELFQNGRGYEQRFDLTSYIAGVVGTRLEKKVGIKILMDHLTYEQYPLANRATQLQIAISETTPLIYLERENILKAALSLVLAMRNNKWQYHSNDLPNKLSFEPIIVPSELIEQKKTLLLKQRIFRNYFNSSLNLVYERDLIIEGSLQSTLNNIANFLNISRSRVQKDALTRKTPMLRNWREMILNFEELNTIWCGDETVGPMFDED